MSTVGNLVDFGLDSDSTASPAGGSVSNYLADGDTTANVVDENLKKTLEAGIQLLLFAQVAYHIFRELCAFGIVAYLAHLFLSYMGHDNGYVTIVLVVLLLLFICFPFS